MKCQTPMDCCICFEKIDKYQTRLDCNHIVCIKCGVRLFLLYKKDLCVLCLAKTSKIYFEFVDNGNDINGKNIHADERKDDENKSGNPPIQVYKTKPLLKNIHTYFASDKISTLIHSLTTYKCKICNQRMPNTVRLADHLIDHRKTICRICVEHKKEFWFEIEYHRSLKNHFHPKCIFCDDLYFNDDELNRHCKLQHERCTFCILEQQNRRDSLFNRGDGLFSTQNGHNEVKSVSEHNEQLNGDEFVEYFRDYESLVAHYRECHYRCILCEAYFLYQSELVQHQNKAHNQNIELRLETKHVKPKIVSLKIHRDTVPIPARHNHRRFGDKNYGTDGEKNCRKEGIEHGRGDGHDIKDNGRCTTKNKSDDAEDEEIRHKSSSTAQVGEMNKKVNLIKFNKTAEDVTQSLLITPKPQPSEHKGLKIIKKQDVTFEKALGSVPSYLNRENFKNSQLAAKNRNMRILEICSDFSKDVIDLFDKYENDLLGPKKFIEKLKNFLGLKKTYEVLTRTVYRNKNILGDELKGLKKEIDFPVLKGVKIENVRSIHVDAKEEKMKFKIFNFKKNK